MSIRPSPWWYRARAFVFGAIYLLGFSLGSIWKAMPAFVWLALQIGVAWLQSLLVCIGLIAIASWALRVWGASYLGAAVVWDPDARDDRLILDGPFRYVRNPLYLGSVLLSAALGSFATPLGFVVIVAGNVLFSLALIHEETPVLRARYGTAFDAYCAAVPALIPRFWHAYVAETAPLRPLIVQGLRSEVFVGCIVLGILAVCVLGQRGVPVFDGIFAVGVGFRIVERMRERQQR